MGKYGWRDNTIRTKKLNVVDKVPVKYTIDARVATSTTALIAGVNLDSNGTAAITPVSMTVQPPYAMRLTLTAKVAGSAAGADSVDIVGTDGYGATISENMLIPGTADTTNTSSYAFSKITTITPNNAIHTSTDVNFGYDATKIGLPYPLAATGDVIAIAAAGAVATTSPLDAVTADKYNVASGSFSNAGGLLSILYKTKVQNI